MPLPALEPLYEHLCALRQAADPSAREHQHRWRVIARWIESAFPGPGQQEQEARQATLISLLRHVHEMRAESALQAAKWIAVIYRRKRVDHARRRAADPVHAALRGDRGDDERPSLIDRLPAVESLVADPKAIDTVLERLMLEIERALEETEPNASKRLLRSTQARATILRVVKEADADAIAAELDYGEPLGKDRIYKWVERGRPVVHLGLDRWLKLADEEERDQVAQIVEAMREIVDERRADAGVPRPDRRKSGDDGART